MYYFIVNPNAGCGEGEKIWRKLERRLISSGAEYGVEITGARGEARKLARELTEFCTEPLVIVAVGGDGTFNEILDGILFDSPVTFGYIPIGMGNDLARALKLPKSPLRGLKRILRGKSCRYLDYGILSYGQGEPVYRRFAVSSGIGLDADVCYHKEELRNRRLLRHFHKMLYVVLGIKQLLSAQPVKGYLLLDGVKKVEFNHIFLISFHIHAYEGGGFRFAPHADGSDGLLEVCVIHNASWCRVLPVLWDALLGRANHHRGVHYYSCKEVQVHLDKPKHLHVDGELCTDQTDIHLRCVEQKIRMLT